MAITFENKIRKLFDFAEIRKACVAAADGIGNQSHNSYFHRLPNGDTMFVYAERDREIDAIRGTATTMCIAVSVFLGETRHIVPSGTTYGPFGKGVSARDIRRDTRFMALLDAAAFEHGLYIESGSMDGNDLYASCVVEVPRTGTLAGAIRANLTADGDPLIGIPF